MTDKQPEAMATAAALETLDMDGVADLVRRQYAELETLRAKLKVYEDLGGAADDVQLLRMGYAAARLEIESLKAQLHAAKQINAAQFGLLTSSIPGSALRASRGQAPAGESLRTLKSPTAQASPAYKDSTPELHIGDSAFESWYSTYSPVHKSDKQRARDAYAAGMGDPLVTAAPAAVAGPSEFPHEKMDAVALGRYKVVSSDQSTFYRFAVVAGDGTQQLYIGREVDCQNMARKFAGAFLDGAFAYHSMTVAPTTQPAPQQEAQEPVAWQSRRMPTWEGNTIPWSSWEPCTKEQAEDCWKTRLLNDWAYEARALYTAPQPTTAPLSEDLRDRLVAISEAIADQDDRAAQAMLREILKAPQPSPAAQGEALDAARLDWLTFNLSGKALRDIGVVWSEHGDARRAIDAARAAQEGKSHDN